MQRKSFDLVVGPLFWIGLWKMLARDDHLLMDFDAG